MSLSELLSDLGDQLPRLDAHVTGAELYGAPRLSVFRLLSPSEPTLSRVIADLLDPRGSHGQGELFINSLLEKVGLPRVTIRDIVRVTREVRTTPKNRRIDIVVETPRVVLGIENKPWAGQLENQLKDYWEYLAGRGKAAGKLAKLVFLSDQQAETARDQIVRISYQPNIEDGASIHGILSSVIRSVKADRTRAFVQDFVEYIDVQFGDGRMGDEQDEPYLKAVLAEFDRGTEKKKALATVLLSARQVHQRILSEIGEFLLRKVQDVTSDFELGRLNNHVFEARDTPLVLAACRTYEINGLIVKQMESTRAFSATKFPLEGALDSFVSLLG